MTAEQLDFKRDLIEACKRQDRSAQSELYHSYADAMYNIAYRMMANQHEAEDMLQSSFVDVFYNLESYNYSATPGAWIKRIVVNNCISALRKKKVSLVYMEETPEQSEEANSEESNYDMAAIKKAMSLLPDGYRTILTLYLIEGYDHVEISSIMGISEATSKSQYSRAKKKLRSMIINKS